MDMVLDHASPVPLYHQIAEAIRYHVATGRRKPGDMLPTVREGALRWSVNLHTVRRAYAQLATLGLVEVRRAQGVRVLGDLAALPSRSQAERFAATMIARASKDYGLSPSQLARLIESVASTGHSIRLPMVSVVECNQAQAEDYARSIAERWSVVATPIVLHGELEPGPGPIISSYFHYNEVRARWPARGPDLHFVPVCIDPTLPQALDSRIRNMETATILVQETDRTRAESIRADLLAVLPADRFQIRIRVSPRPGAALGTRARTPVVFAPRIWARLSERHRTHSLAFQLRYIIEPAALAALGSRFGWSAQSQQSRAFDHLRKNEPRASKKG